MQTIRYSATKLTLAVVGGIAMAAFAPVLIDSPRGKIQFAGYIFLIIGPLLSLISLKTLLGERVALRFDHRTVEIATLWRRRTLNWSDVASVGVSTVSTYGAFGLVKTGSSDTIAIKTKPGMFGGKEYGVAKGFLALDSAGYVKLLGDLVDAFEGNARHAPAVPPEGAAAPFRQPAEAPSLNGAPIAAASGIQAERMPRPAVGGFGRKGL